SLRSPARSGYGALVPGRMAATSNSSARDPQSTSPQACRAVASYRRSAGRPRGHDPHISPAALGISNVGTDSGYRCTDSGMELLAAGHSIGYLLKSRVTDVDEFIDALTRIAHGGSVIDPALVQELVAARRRNDPLDVLSPREREVLALMAEGRSNAVIGRRLWVTEGTVEKHVRSILLKLQVPETDDDHRRVRAVITYLEARQSLPGGGGPGSRPGTAPSWRGPRPRGTPRSGRRTPPRGAPRSGSPIPRPRRTPRPGAAQDPGRWRRTGRCRR